MWTDLLILFALRYYILGYEQTAWHEGIPLVLSGMETPLEVGKNVIKNMFFVFILQISVVWENNWYIKNTFSVFNDDANDRDDYVRYTLLPFLSPCNGFPLFRFLWSYW